MAHRQHMVGISDKLLPLTGKGVEGLRDRSAATSSINNWPVEPNRPRLNGGDHGLTGG